MYVINKELLKLTKCTIHIKSEIVCIVRGLTIEHRHEMHDKYNFYIDNYINHPRVVAGLWDGKKSFFTPSGTTYTLLLEYLVKDLVGMGYEIDIVDDTNPIVHIDFMVKPDIFCDCFDKYGNPFKLRDYQCDSANILLEYGNGIIEAATSAGKGSMICAISKAIISTKGFKIIIIVPNTTLITQSIEECKQYNIDVGEFSGSVKDLNHPVVVSTWQTLKNSPKVLGQFSALICDECFSGESLVAMADNTSKQIKDVKVGDVVKSYDLSTHTQVDKQVTNTHKNLKKYETDNMIRLFFDNNVTIDVTENHIFYTETGPKKAKDLTNNDILLNISETHGVKA